MALGLLVVGLATIGAQVQSSADASRDMHRMLRAVNLAESKLAELDSGQIIDVQSAVESDLEEEFGRLFPQYAWRLRVEPTVTADLWLITLGILYQDRRDVTEEFDFETAETLYTLRTLRATPATINPQRDFGLDEESMQSLAGAFAGTDLDPYNLDFRQLGALPLDQLLELLTALDEAGMLAGLDLESILPPDVWSMLQEALDSGDEEGDANGNDNGSDNGGESNPQENDNGEESPEGSGP